MGSRSSFKSITGGTMQIINSLLDTDYYKFTMGQYAWKYFPRVMVKYAFKNRTKDVKLGNFINRVALLKQLDYVRGLRLTMEELNYLKSLKIFSIDYLAFLSRLRLPPVYINCDNGELSIETEGLWAEALFWETFILSIVNELYYQHFSHNPAGGMGEFQSRLDEKISRIVEEPFKFVEFGTRRRYSYKIQDKVIDTLCSMVPNDYFLGTSNVYFAMSYGIPPIGTMAHELPMVLAGLSYYDIDVLKNSHDKMLTMWEYLYGKPLTIALTDTFGSDFFFRTFTEEQARFWKGLRQDSGNPFEFGKKVIKFYEEKGINPKEKIVIFSDGLDINVIQKLEKEFKGKFITMYGWGTNLTNDLGYKPLSIVVKAVEADGNPLVKLSDNLSKANGNEETIEKYKQIFVYNNTVKIPTYY
jgi:nicotinate phosphoribosyltransferase